MFLLNKFFLLGVGGFAVAGTGTGLGVYYGTQGSRQPKSPEETGKPEAPKSSALPTQVDASPRADGSADSSSQPGPGGK